MGCTNKGLMKFQGHGRKYTGFQGHGLAFSTALQAWK